jgi:hypothetical protein
MVVSGLINLRLNLKVHDHLYQNKSFEVDVQLLTRSQKAKVCVSLTTPWPALDIREGILRRIPGKVCGWTFEGRFQSELLEGVSGRGTWGSRSFGGTL